MALSESLGIFAFVAILFLVTLNCFCLRDFSRSRLEEVCRRRGYAERFSQILQNHDRHLLLSEIAVLVLLLVGAALFTDIYLPAGLQVPGLEATASAIGIASWAGNFLALVCGASFLLVALPWTLARVAGEQWLAVSLPLVSPVYWLLSPLWYLLSGLDRIVHRIFELPEPDSAEATHMLTDELLSVVDESHREGVIQSTASTMIRRVVDLQNEDVASIMTPRTDMVTIDGQTPMKEAIMQMLEAGFSRIPVTGESVDDITGILYARDLLSCATAEPDGIPVAAVIGDTNQAANTAGNASDQSGRHSVAEMTAAGLAREALFVPESQGIGDLLDAMRARKVHMAIVVDEYSGVSGLVTMEDILEEIVGEIADEYDTQDETLWKEVSEGVTAVDAKYHLDDLNEEFGYDFPEDEEFDTIGGLVLSLFGRIPEAGEQTDWNSLNLVVLEADQRSISKVRIEGVSELKESRRAASD